VEQADAIGDPTLPGPVSAARPGGEVTTVSIEPEVARERAAAAGALRTRGLDHASKRAQTRPTRISAELAAKVRQ